MGPSVSIIYYQQFARGGRGLGVDHGVGTIDNRRFTAGELGSHPCFERFGDVAQ